MRTLGICVGFAANTRMIVRGVVLDGSRTSPRFDQTFELRTASDDLADQVDDLTRELRSRASGLDVQRVVMRIADFNPRPSNRPGPRSRLMLEGALMFIMREIAPGEELARDGQELGQVLGSSKKDAIEAGKAIAAKSADAAAAALSGLD